MVDAVIVDWGQIVDAGCPVPPGVPLEDLLADLEDMLASPVMALRDGTAYPILAAWVERGALDAELEELGNRLAARLGDPRPQARSFAVLALAEVVGRVAVTAGPLVPTGVVRAWLTATIAWYTSEGDLRAWDDDCGWLHAPAHGADALGVFALSPRLTAADVGRIATALLDRLLDPATPLFADGEDARIAQAFYGLCCRDDVDRDAVDGWFALVEARVTAGARGSARTPPWLSNTVRALQMLYVLVDSRAAVTLVGTPVVCGSADAVRAAVLRSLAPWWPPLRP